MKTPTILKHWFILCSTVALGVLATATASAQTPSPKLRVGVYDSRAVAVAYANSTEFREAMKAVEAEHQKAKAAKDEKRMKEIESQMQAKQRRAHEQGFSTGSVAAIMATVKDSLPTLAKQAGVQVIVSKWELNHHAAEVEIVDVTDQLVARFHVSEKGLKWCKEIQQKPPLPLEQLGEHLD